MLTLERKPFYNLPLKSFYLFIYLFHYIFIFIALCALPMVYLIVLLVFAFLLSFAGMLSCSTQTEVDIWIRLASGH